MKVLIVSGGSEEGNSKKQSLALQNYLVKNNNVTIIDLIEKRIEQCIGCNKCKSGKCIFDDDFNEILNIFNQSDLIVFSTPLRFNGPSSLIKTWMDRFQMVWNNKSLLQNKKRMFGAMINCGSNYPRLDPSLTIFRSFSASFEGKWIGHSITAGTDMSTQFLISDAERFGKLIEDSVS